MKEDICKFFLLIILILFNISKPGYTNSDIKLNNVFYSIEEKTLSLYSNNIINPQIRKFKKPDRLVIDLPDTIFFPTKKEISVQDLQIQKIRISQYKLNPSIVRIVIDLNSEIDFDVYNDSTNEGYILKFLFNDNNVSKGFQSFNKTKLNETNFLKKIEKKDNNKIVLKTNNRIQPEIRKVKNSLEYIIDIPGLKFNNVGEIPLRLKSLKNFRLIPIKNNTRIYLELYENFTMEANISEDGKELELIMTKTDDLLDKVVTNKNSNDSLEQLKILKEENKTKIVLTNSKPFIYNIFSSNDSYRLIIDTYGLELSKILDRDDNTIQFKSDILNNIKLDKWKNSEREGIRLIFNFNEPVIYQSRHSDDQLSLEITLTSTLIKKDKNNSKTLIVLDPGHGGKDCGAVGPTGIKEKDVTLEVVRFLRRILVNNGYRVLLTREDDLEVLLQPRVDVANNNNADLFISIHCNAVFNKPGVYGVETYYNNDQSKKLATAIQNQLVKQAKVNDRSIRYARFYVIRKTNMPSVLVEIGYLTNPDEEQKLNNLWYQRIIAQAVFSGIKDYLEKEKDLVEINL